jgi:asparagine synthase (glutamine-hydrolysing)
LLSDRARSDPDVSFYHDWLQTPHGASPGKAGHIASIMNIQNHLEGFAREHDRPVIAPLLAQPLVELCLRIPASLWCAGGRDRAIAREAFTHRLPAEILSRREKGAPDGFVARLYTQHRAVIGEMLAEGELARADLLDQPALSRAISSDAPPSGTTFLRVMKLLDAEMWARSIRSQAAG